VRKRRLRWGALRGPVSNESDDGKGTELESHADQGT